jgi:hypothetical protein
MGTYNFKQYSMVFYGCFDSNYQLVGNYKKCLGGYITKVKVKDFFYFSGVYPTVRKAQKAILKRLANGN